MKRSFFFQHAAILLMSLSLLFSGGCGRTVPGQTQPDNPEPSSQPAANATLGSSGDVISENALPENGDDEVQLVAAVPEPVSDLGTAIYRVGSQEAVLDYLPARGGSVSLEDAQGNVWVLNIPPNALSSPTTITMRALENVSLPGLEGMPAGGVSLEPDGLYFSVSAFLGVTGPIATDKSCMFHTAAAGKQVQFGHFFLNEGVLTTRVDHFSSVIAGNPSTQADLDALADMAEQEAKNAERDAKAFLKTPITAPPAPADMEVSCSGSGDGALSQYLQQVVEPERTYIKKLLGSGKEASLLGRDTDTLYLAQELSKRLIKKADKLIRTYRNDNKKLVPVLHVTITILKEANLLGCDALLSDYSGVFADWMLRAADEILEEIRTEHQYTKLCKLLSLLRTNAILDGSYHNGGSLYEVYSEKLAKALRFKMTIEVVATGVDSDGTRSTWKSEGTVPLWFDLKTLSDRGLFLTGEGTCKYTDFETTGEGMEILENPDAMKAQVRLDGTIQTDSASLPMILQMDIVNPDTLSYRDKDGNVFTFNSMSMVYKNFFIEWYNAGYIEKSFPLQNGQAVVLFDMAGDMDNARGSAVITIEHLP